MEFIKTKFFFKFLSEMLCSLLQRDMQYSVCRGTCYDLFAEWHAMICLQRDMLCSVYRGTCYALFTERHAMLCLQSDMERSLKSSKPTVNEEDLKKLTKFSSDFGQDGWRARIEWEEGWALIGQRVQCCSLIGWGDKVWLKEAHSLIGRENEV